jgi:hypothetical protein
MFIGRSCRQVCACLSFGVQVSGVQGSDISKRAPLNFRQLQPRCLQYFPESIEVKRHFRATEAMSDTRLEETSESMDAADKCGDMDEPWTAEEIRGLYLLERIIGAKDARPVSRKLLERVIFSQSSSIEEREAGKVLGILLPHNTHPIDEYFLKIAVQMGGDERTKITQKSWKSLQTLVIAFQRKTLRLNSSSKKVPSCPRLRRKFVPPVTI